MMDKTKLPSRSLSDEENLQQEIWDDGVTSQVAVQHIVTFEPGLDAHDPAVNTYIKDEQPEAFRRICEKYEIDDSSISQLTEFVFTEMRIGPDYKHAHVYPNNGPYNPVSENNDVVVVCVDRQPGGGGGLAEKTSGPALT